MNHDINTDGNEITLKEIFLKIHEYFFEVLRNWWLIGLFVLPFLAFFLFKTFSHTPLYKADVRFVMEGQSGGGLSALGGLLGSFGINRGGGSTNPYKIIEVAKSKRIIGEVLFTESADNGEFLSNNIIDLYELSEEWAESSPEMKGLKFSEKDINAFAKNERKAFLSLFVKTIGKEDDREEALLKINFNEETGIFSIKGATVNEAMTLDLVNNLYDRTKVYFQEQVEEEQVKSRNILKEKADSIKTLLESKLFAKARFQDSSKGLVSRESEITIDKFNAEIQSLSLAWAEIQKTLEIADYELQNTKPLFSIIDQPYSPLKPTEESLIINIILAILMGGATGFIFVVLRKFYRDIMND